MGKVMRMLREQGEVSGDKFCLSVEEFEVLTEEHEFSEKYRKKKQKILRQYKKSMDPARRSKMIKTAAAVVILVTAMPVLAAASGSDFFYRIWGTAGKENISPHEETLYGEREESACVVTYPKREYTDDNLDKADELIGDAISREPVVKEIGDTKLTVWALISDGNAAVAEFTLEKAGGVDFFNYSQLDNESKGAWFSEDAPFYFSFDGCGESIYVDLDKSSGDILYCYDYIAMHDSGMRDGLILEICRWSDDEEDGEEREALFVPVKRELEKKGFVNGAGGVASVSSIAMKVDLSTGLGLSREEACDPWNVWYAAVNYKDGSRYIVHEHEIEGIHACEYDIDNNGYVCGDVRGGITFVFNRLVDTDEIESVTVNDMLYEMQQGCFMKKNSNN